jgi:hypothetical protein
MSRLTSNLIANLSASAATAGIGIVVVLVYLHLLGTEACGRAFYLGARSYPPSTSVSDRSNREVASSAEPGPTRASAASLRGSAGTPPGSSWRFVITGARPSPRWLTAHALSVAQVTFVVRLIELDRRTVGDRVLSARDPRPAASRRSCRPGRATVAIHLAALSLIRWHRSMCISSTRSSGVLRFVALPPPPAILSRHEGFDGHFAVASPPAG